MYSIDMLSKIYQKETEIILLSQDSDMLILYAKNRANETGKNILDSFDYVINMIKSGKENELLDGQAGTAQTVSGEE